MSLSWRRTVALRTRPNEFGMVVGERCETGAELEAREAAMLSNPASVEFRDEDVS